MKGALYDIFRKDLLGTPVWMESVQDLEMAELRMMELLGRSPGEYFLVWPETGEIVSDTTPTFAIVVPNADGLRRRTLAASLPITEITP